MKVALPVLLCVWGLSGAAVLAAADSLPLEERLRSSSYWERMRALQEVAAVPPDQQPRYVPLIVAALEDEDIEFRLAAVRALSGFGENAKPALPAIVQTLEIRNGEARIQLVHDIAKLGSLVVPALISALDDPDAYLAWGACDTLAEIGAPARSAIPALNRLVSDSRPEVREGARAALLVLGDD